MSDNNAKTESCPICEKEAEVGYITGNTNAFNTFKWLEGDPTLWKNIIPFVGDYIGEAAILTGSYLMGLRCNNYKKIILNLDY